MALGCKSQSHFVYRRKKDIYDYTENLERCLSLMISGKDIGSATGGLTAKELGYRDTLWDKIFGKLNQLQDIWKKKSMVKMSRHYGLLQTIVMTGSQVHRLMMRQQRQL